MDLLSNALNAIKVGESKGKTSCTVRGSKLIKSVLQVLKEQNYIESFEEVKTPEKSMDFVIRLNGKVNNCGPVRPRFYVKSTEWDKYENRYLPSKDIGMLVISTSRGVVSHAQAKHLNVGGSLLAFVY